MDDEGAPVERARQISAGFHLSRLPEHGPVPLTRKGRSAKLARGGKSSGCAERLKADGCLFDHCCSGDGALSILVAVGARDPNRADNLAV